MRTISLFGTAPSLSASLDPLSPEAHVLGGHFPPGGQASVLVAPFANVDEVLRRRQQGAPADALRRPGMLRFAVQANDQLVHHPAGNARLFAGIDEAEQE